MIYAVNKRTKEHEVMDPSALYNTSLWDEVQATPDGWIEWRGGECPLPDGAIHDVKFRDGVKVDEHEPPESWYWHHKGENSDIIAYRPILDDESETLNLDGIGDTVDLSKRPEPPAWGGEGLPPAGCRCLVRGAPGGTLCRAVIDYIDGKHCVWHWDNGSAQTIYARAKYMEFRPIRSEEDREIDTLAADILDTVNRDGVDFRHRERVMARRLHDMGYRKQ